MLLPHINLPVVVYTNVHSPGVWPVLNGMCVCTCVITVCVVCGVYLHCGSVLEQPLLLPGKCTKNEREDQNSSQSIQLCTEPHMSKPDCMYMYIHPHLPDHSDFNHTLLDELTLQSVLDK